MRLRTVLVVMLALLWAPVTSHCLFERLDGFDFLSCCAHEEAEASASHETEGCSEDACAVVESGFYKLQDYEQLLVVADEVVFIGAQIENGHEIVTAPRPPPELAVAWQFSARAAAPVRAPSSLL